MISAISWVPKGASKYVPEVAEPPSKEEIEEMVKGDLPDRRSVWLSVILIFLLALFYEVHKDLVLI